MKRIFNGLALVLSLWGGAACQREPGVAAGDAAAGIRICARAEDLSRSLSGADESVVRNLNVYAYRDGALAGKAYGDGGELTLSVLQGYTYRIYALANVGEQEPPSLESGLEAWRVALPAAAYAAAGLPMACRHGTAFHAARPSATLQITLERLVGKVCLTLEKNLSRTDFRVEGVKILQAAADVTPFAHGSRALCVEDGDAASEADVASLNRGGEVCFYVPENDGGVLLPGNLDQWGKVPSNIGGMAERCTYMQVWGSWSTPGASADVAYRMYLGKDNCSDFSIDGNSESLLTLSLTDEGVFTASWKVEMRNFRDDRRLRFSSASLSLSQGGGAAQLFVIADPPDLEYELYADQEPLQEAQLSYSQEGTRLHLHTAYIGAQEKRARLFLRSWDGLLRDTLTVTVPYIGGQFEDFTYTMPRYVAQWGSFRFPDASASAPVRFAASGHQEFIFPGAGRWSFYDHAAGLRFVYDGDTTVWVQANDFPAGDGSPCTLVLGCGSLSRTLSLYPGIVPRYGFRQELTLSECGNLNRDDRGWYDREADLHLLDEEGNVLDFSLFATPDALLRLWGSPLTDDARYAGLAEVYSESMWGEFSEEGYAQCSVTFLSGELDDLLPENSLARFRLWGLMADGDAPADLFLNIVNDGLRRCYEQPVPLRVVPAFPAQRYLGEYENRQIAPGDMRSYSVALDFTQGNHDAPAVRDVGWTLYSAVFDPDDKPSSVMLDPLSKRCQNVSFDGKCLNFSYNRASGDPLCAGGYGIEGETRNAHSGRTIRGWYTFDVVLLMSVGAAVDNVGGTVMGYSFVPFCEYSAASDSDLWNDSLPPVPIVAPQEDGSIVYTTIHVPERASEHACRLSLNGNYDIAGHSVSYNCNYFYYFTNWQYLGDFHFYADGRRTTVLDLSRAGFAATQQFHAPDYVRGSMGYYRLCRQRDLANLPDGGTNGLSNYLVEAAWGTFEDL